MPKKPLILIGGGGHCKSCIDVIESTNEWEIKGILDQNIRVGELVLNYPVIGNDNKIDELKNDHYFLITVGQLKSAVIRERIFDNLKLKNARLAIVVSSKAIISKYSCIGQGTIIHHACTINADTNIGENNIINTGANIEHDVTIGDNNHISTHAILNGNVVIGDACFIGSGAIIANGITLKNQVVVGAGGVVIKNIDEPGIYAGSPAKRIGK